MLRAKAEEIGGLREKHKNVLIMPCDQRGSLFCGGRRRATGEFDRAARRLAGHVGDSLVYAFSLYVLWRGAAWKAKAALLKGAIMAVFGAGVVLEVIYKTISGVVPSAETMGIVGALVFLGNGIVSCCSFAIGRMISTCVPRGCARATTSSLISRYWWPRPA